MRPLILKGLKESQRDLEMFQILIIVFALAAFVPSSTAQIAFCSNRDGNFEIYVMNTDGSNPVRLTNDPAQDVTPAWSPDRTKIAFGSTRTGNTDVYVMNADGCCRVIGRECVSRVPRK